MASKIVTLLGYELGAPYRAYLSAILCLILVLYVGQSRPTDFAFRLRFPFCLSGIDQFLDC